MLVSEKKHQTVAIQKISTRSCPPTFTGFFLEQDFIAFVKIFIKKLMIPLFLATTGDWTPDSDDALEFNDGCQAIEFSQKHRVAQAEIYYHFDNPRYDFSIELKNHSES
jgi:hypothetical protein